MNEAQSQASMQAKKLNLKSDGHGGWLDSRGNFVATTEDGKLKFTDKKPKKAEDDTAGKAKAAQPQAQPKKPQPTEAQPKPKAKKPEEGEGGGESGEQTEDLTIVFGRFNPPTVGHEKLLSQAKKTAGGGDLKIYPSRTQDPKKNPWTLT